MIIVRVELHSAITGEITEIARAHIANTGGDRKRGSYQTYTMRGRSKDQLDRIVMQRSGVVLNYPRLSLHVWHLIARALIAMGYAGKNEQPQETDLFEADPRDAAAQAEARA